MITSQDIIKVISDHLGVPQEQITAESRLAEDLNATRLEIADLVSTLEKSYFVKIDPEEAKKCKTAGDITSLFLDLYELH